MTTTINLVLQQAADFLAGFQINDANNNPINISSLTIESMVKHDYQSNSSATWSFNCNGYANGFLTISLPGSNTATINAGSYVYDVMVKDSTNALSRVIEGVIKVTPNVTNFV